MPCDPISVFWPISGLITCTGVASEYLYPRMVYEQSKSLVNVVMYHHWIHAMKTS